MATAFNSVKVFSATKSRERESLGDKVTRWIQEDRPDIVDNLVLQSSDSEYHCLSMVFFYNEFGGAWKGD